MTLSPWLGGRPKSRPEQVHDTMLQQERTALAWERTGFTSIVAGLLFVRTASRWHPLLTLIGFAQVLFGCGLLIWAGYHYDKLHGPLRAGDSPVHPSATRAVGLVTAAFTGMAALAAIVAVTIGF